MNDKFSILQKLEIRDLCDSKREAIVDIQGWNSQNKLLLNRVNATTNPLIIEVGVWKGGSSIAMAQQLASKNANGTVVAIDTFLGSSEHYLSGKVLDSVGIGPRDELRLLQIFL